MIQPCNCEQLAQRAGFDVSVGNWILPDGGLIKGENYETHHWETIKKYIDNQCDNQLKLMNQKISEGYIRVVIRTDLSFQMHGSLDDIWSDKPNCKTLINILKKVNSVDVHVFSKTFYVIGTSKNIAKCNKEDLEIKCLIT